MSEEKRVAVLLIKDHPVVKEAFDKMEAESKILIEEVKALMGKKDALAKELWSRVEGYLEETKILPGAHDKRLSFKDGVLYDCSSESKENHVYGILKSIFS